MHGSNCTVYINMYNRDPSCWPENEWSTKLYLQIWSLLGCPSIYSELGCHFVLTQTSVVQSSPFHIQCEAIYMHTCRNCIVCTAIIQPSIPPSLLPLLRSPLPLFLSSSLSLSLSLPSLFLSSSSWYTWIRIRSFKSHSFHLFDRAETINSNSNCFLLHLDIWYLPMVFITMHANR